MKRWFLMLVLIVCFLLVAACSNSSNGQHVGAANDVQQVDQQQGSTPGTGNQPNQEAENETTDHAEQSPLDQAVHNVLEEKQEVNISFWTGTGAANFPVLESMVQAFEAAYPNIKVEFSNQGPIGELTDKLTQNIVAKSTPTLSNIDATTFPEYIKSGAIVDLLPYYEHEKIGLAGKEEDVFSYYIDRVQSFGPDGTMYGFPTNKKTADVLVYNKTYFDNKGWEPPQTWDQVVQYAEEIYEETGKPGFSFDNSYGAAPFELLSRQWGSSYIREDGQIDIDNEASLAALQFYKQNMEQGLFTMPALMPSAGGKFSSNGFVMEETYMFVGAAAGVRFAIPNPESGHKDFEIGIAPVPQRDVSTPVYYAKGEDYVVFSNSTEEERVAAWLLIAFLTNAQQNVQWLIETGNLPISEAMLNEPEYQAFLNTEPNRSAEYYKAAAVSAVMSVGELTFNKVIPQSSKLAEVVGQMWEAVMIGGGDPEQQLMEAADKLK